MIKRGTGDEGLAEDLESLADTPIFPAADWGELLTLLVRLDDTRLSSVDRAEVEKLARQAANGHPDALRLVQDKIDETS